MKIRKPMTIEKRRIIPMTIGKTGIKPMTIDRGHIKPMTIDYDGELNDAFCETSEVKG